MSKQIAAVPSSAAGRRHFLQSGDWPPLLLVLATAIMALGLNLGAGLIWHAPIYRVLGMTVALLAIALFFTYRHAAVTAREVALYLAFWSFFPLYATQLSFLAATVDFPLQDNLFLFTDAAMGFHWDRWLSFSDHHPDLLQVQMYAYSSLGLQPLLTVPIVAMRGPPGRNSEFLTAVLLASGCTIALFTLLPTVGPAAMFGQYALQTKFIYALRAGVRGPYYPAGIVSFPSFHMVMALLFTAAHRGIRTFWPVAALNLVMMTAIPVVGDHYLSDLAGGAVIAALAFVLTRWIYRRLAPAKAPKKERAVPEKTALAASII